jgi:hypothetical protein
MAAENSRNVYSHSPVFSGCSQLAFDLSSAVQLTEVAQPSLPPSKEMVAHLRSSSGIGVPSVTSRRELRGSPWRYARRPNNYAFIAAQAPRIVVDA